MFDAIDRRDAIARMALLLGAATLPGEAFAAPKAKAKQTLAKSQFALLSAVCDTIVPKTDTPGALAAKVPARLDGMLGAWASPATREKILSALGRIEAASKSSTGKSFAALSAQQRADVLRPFDAAALKRMPVKPGSGGNPFVPAQAFADDGYYKIKELVIGLYYFSPEAVATELVYEHVPGKFEPSIKLTPTSRPYLGTGPF